jgi:hypothetical protein
MMLVVILAMEYKERGLFFNWPQEGSKWRMPIEPIEYMRKYHGYAFNWAVVYTFWYHPMEPTFGHSVGFILTALIMFQGSLMYTTIHLNKYWRLFNEAFVIVHGGLVAYQTGGPKLGGHLLWPMFLFGFTLIFVLTQIHGLPFWNTLPGYCRIIPLVLYSIACLACYGTFLVDDQGSKWIRMNEIVRIPLIEYLFVVLLVGIMAIILRCFQPTKIPSNEGEAAESKRRNIALSIFFLTYLVCVVVSVLFYPMMNTNLIVVMAMLVSIFILLVSISSVALEYTLHRVRDAAKNVYSDEAKVDMKTAVPAVQVIEMKTAT